MVYYLRSNPLSRLLVCGGSGFDLERGGRFLSFFEIVPYKINASSYNFRPGNSQLFNTFL